MTGEMPADPSDVDRQGAAEKLKPSGLANCLRSCLDYDLTIEPKSSDSILSIRLFADSIWSRKEKLTFVSCLYTVRSVLKKPGGLYSSSVEAFIATAHPLAVNLYCRIYDLKQERGVNAIAITF